MVRSSRRLKDKKVDQKPAEKKHTSEIYLVTLDLDEYDLSLGPYLYSRLKWAFDDENVNIMFDEDINEETKEVTGYRLECQPDKNIPKRIIDKEFREAYNEYKRLYHGVRNTHIQV